MKSGLPKVMHELAGLPLIAHVLAAAKSAGMGRLSVVIGPGMDNVAETVRAIDPKIEVAVQAEQLGTADAVKAAQASFEGHAGPVVVIYGDTPLLQPATLRRLDRELADGADLVVIGFDTDDPNGYGRIILDERGRILAIREYKDASEEERAIKLCNSGIMGFAGGAMLTGLLARIGNKNAKGEYYLTDAVALARADGLETRMVKGEAVEVLGVNSRGELAKAEAILQARLRAEAMEAGATFIAPETVFLSHDTRIGRDVLIEPNVFIGPGVLIEDNVTIRGFCHIVGSHIAEGAIIGPFARLRPGAMIGRNAHIGNFVEIKQADVAGGAKVNHLTYIGDASIGAGANIGAGTITCNYDGFAKYRTEIGAGAFIGSNSSLVAPVKIGEGAYVGSGSVITKDVAPDSLALTRAPQEERAGWARERRKRKDGGNKAT